MATLPKGQGVFLPPFKAWLASNIPAVYDNTMTYYEELVALIKYLQDIVVPAVNDNASAVTTISNAVEQLQSYVENYFANLDVQEEINTKLDAMAEDGTLADIISQYLNSTAIFSFDSIDELKSSENLVNGSYAKIVGYYKPNDGGDGLFFIRNKTLSDVIDDNKIVEISPTLVAELVNNSTINTNLGVNLWLRNTNIDDVKDNIDAYKFMGVTNLVLCIHLDGDNCTVQEDTTLVNQAISYANSKLININTVKFHCTNANLKTSSNYRDLYKQHCVEFLNALENVTITRLVVFNEMNSMFNSFASNDDANVCASIVNYFKNLGYDVSISVAGVEYFLDCYYSHPEVTNLFDFIAINSYPIIGDNKNYTSEKEVKEVYEEFYKQIQLIKSYYPTKQLIISEIGVQNVWESLSSPANYLIKDMAGVTNAYGKIIPLFFGGLINDNRMNEMLSEVWLWYSEYYNDYLKQTVIFRNKFVGGNN